MRILFYIVVCIVVALVSLPGCESSGDGARLFGRSGARQLFSVDFQQEQSLRYRFVSKRNVVIDFSATTPKHKSGKSKLQRTNERMELVMSYTPVEADAGSPATIEAKCDSANVRRSSVTGKKTGTDAVTILPGRSFNFEVTASGQMQNRSELEQLIKELGEAAFGRGNKKRTKNPDMILDFIATQWFLWDSVSSIKRPAQGVAVGRSWSSKLLVPLPIPMLVGRDVTYTLEEVRETEAGRIAVITSSYSLAERAGRGWPMPYSGRFRMAGMFGFFMSFGGYEVLGLSGHGEQLFNIDTGRIESDRQEYEVQLKAAMPFGAAAKSDAGDLKPNMTVKQEITMQLLEDT